MSPDAPAPVYDSHGNQVSDWHVRVGYDSIRDEVTVSWSIAAGPYNKASHGSNSYPPVDLEDAIADVQRSVRICGARRLF